jgi:glycosyltransferase involved in cell wall biosynthesis
MSPRGLLRLLVLFHEPELLGAGTSVLNAVDALREYGWSVSGWVPGPGMLAEAAAAKLDDVVVARRPLAVSVRGWREAPGAAARLRATPPYIAALRRALLEVRPHVVHANTLRSLPEAVVARSFGLPLAFHVHELPPPTLKREATVRVAGRVGDVMVGVSDAVTVMLRQRSRRTPVLTVRNGVEPMAGRRPDGDGTRPFTVGTIGTVSRLKGTDVFLRAAALAAAQRSGLRFEHAGQADQHRDRGLDDELAALTAEPQLDGAAAMLGRTPAAELLARWNLFVLPSRMDAFPLATLEAMAAGVPVIASAVGGVPEQITHLENGILVAPANPKELADWIVRLHDDTALRSRLAANARARVEEEFSVRLQAAGLHDAYLTALNRRFGPPQVRTAGRSG